PAGGRAPRLHGLRLRRGLAVCAVLLAAAGWLVYSGLATQDHAATTVLHRLQPLQALNQRLGADFAGSQDTLRAYIDTGEPRFLRLYHDHRRAAATELAAAARSSSGASH